MNSISKKCSDFWTQVIRPDIFGFHLRIKSAYQKIRVASSKSVNRMTSQPRLMVSFVLGPMCGLSLSYKNFTGFTSLLVHEHFCSCLQIICFQFFCNFFCIRAKLSATNITESLLSLVCYSVLHTKTTAVKPLKPKCTHIVRYNKFTEKRINWFERSYGIVGIRKECSVRYVTYLLLFSTVLYWILLMVMSGFQAYQWQFVINIYQRYKPQNSG